MADCVVSVWGGAHTITRNSDAREMTEGTACPWCAGCAPLRSRGGSLRSPYPPPAIALGAPSALVMRALGAPALRRLRPPLRGLDLSRLDAGPDRPGHQESSPWRSTRCAPQSRLKSREISGMIFRNCSRYAAVSRNLTSTRSSTLSAPRNPIHSR